MNLASRAKVEDVLIQLENGNLSRQQALWEILEMPQTPDFEGIWEALIIHVCLTELAARLPQLQHLTAHWQKEIRAWQQRLQRFNAKAKPSFRNALRHDFEQAYQQLLQNDAVKLVLNLEMHVEDVLDVNAISLAEWLIPLNLPERGLEWFLNYE